jgi:diguanylate cyclase (GGDEF)-like protein
MTSPYVPYMVTEAFCIVFALSILFRLERSIGSEHEVRELRHMIYAYLVMLAADICWTLFESNTLLPPKRVNLTVDAILVAAISFGCYSWFMFIQDRLHQTRPVRKSRVILLTVPIAAICLLDFLSIFTEFLFYLDAENHYQSSAAFFLQSAVNYFYLVVPTVACAWRAFRTRSKTERTEYATYAAYMIAPLIGGLLEGVFLMVPVLSLSMFMIIQILFLMIQNMQIYNDALTNLNNRRRLNQYLESCLSKASADQPVVVLMMDLNRFKHINDTYGHIEGDNALRKFAEVLRQAAVPYRAFIARYGGDEFCLVATGPKRDPEALAADIQRLLLSAQDGKQAPSGEYLLTVSIGAAVCSQPDTDPEAVLAQADQMLYARKDEWRRNHS